VAAALEQLGQLRCRCRVGGVRGDQLLEQRLGGDRHARLVLLERRDGVEQRSATASAGRLTAAPPPLTRSTCRTTATAAAGGCLARSAGSSMALRPARAGVADAVPLNAVVAYSSAARS